MNNTAKYMNKYKTEVRKIDYRALKEDGIEINKVNVGFKKYMKGWTFVGLLTSIPVSVVLFEIFF